MSDGSAVGVDIGGTKLLAALIRADGSVSDWLRVQTPSTPDGISDIVGELARKLMSQHGRGTLPVGVGAAGIVGADGVMRFAPNVAWTDYPLREELERRIDSPVLVDNDANVAAWGEYRAGAGRDARHGMLMLTIGTGIGGGLIADDRLYRGFQGFASEFGHIIVLEGGPACPCGNHGCLEALASGSAIGRLAKEAAAAGQVPDDSALHGELEPTGKSVTLAAQAGDEFAVGILQRCGFWLGVGIATLVNALDPELVVVGGGAMEAGDLLLSPARAAFLDRLEGRGHRVPPDVVGAHLGDQAGMIGAALLAVDAAADRLAQA